VGAYLFEGELVVVDHGISSNHIERRERVGEEDVQVRDVLGPGDPDRISLHDQMLEEFHTVAKRSRWVWWNATGRDRGEMVGITSPCQCESHCL
jgi:uridine phosphorylase